MNPRDLQNQLAENLQQVSKFLEELPEAHLHRSPDSRWTIAEELLHLIKSNAGTTHLLSKPTEQLRVASQPSRSYENLVQEYQEKYAAVNPPRGPQDVKVGEAEGLGKSLFITQWNKTSQALQECAKAWPESVWSKYTVWKHPLLRALTVQEMLYFTAFHNEHHAGIMEEKYESLVNTTTS